MKSGWVYILQCADGSYYVGSTSNLSQRVAEHQAGKYCGYTASRRPVTLAWSQEFAEIREAIEAERKLKHWTRAKKEALMRGDFGLLHELSKSSETKGKADGQERPSTESRKALPHSPFDSADAKRRPRSG